MNQLSLREIICKYDDENILSQRNIKSLIKRKDNHENTILHFASIYNRINLVKQLIEQHNMKAKDKNIDGMSAYIIAAKNGNYEIVKYFIENQMVDINEMDDENNNALIYASYFDDNATVVEYLISKNININQKNKLGKTALDIATSNKSHSIINIIKSSAINLSKYIVTNIADENCIICLCELKKEESIIKLACNHLYHKECLTEWLKTDDVKEECLYCKHSI